MVVVLVVVVVVVVTTTESLSFVCQLKTVSELSEGSPQ